MNELLGLKHVAYKLFSRCETRFIYCFNDSALAGPETFTESLKSLEMEYIKLDEERYLNTRQFYIKVHSDWKIENKGPVVAYADRHFVNPLIHF